MISMKTLPIDPAPACAEERESLAYRIGTVCRSAFAQAVVIFAWCTVAVWEFTAAAINTLLLGKGVREQLRELEERDVPARPRDQ